MNKTIFTLSLVVLTLFLLNSCGNSVLYDDDKQENLKQFIFVVPDRYSGEPQAAYTPSKTAYIRVNQDVKICAMYTLNDSYIASDKTTDNLESVLWLLGDESFNIPIFRYTFNEPGHFQAYLNAVDFYGDTLKDTLDIYVNTPISIDLLSPEDKANYITADKDTTIKLRWSVNGIDEWETSRCYVYASPDRKLVWKTPLGEVNCHDGANLNGIFPSDTTIYWGLKVYNSTNDYFEEKDSSKVFSFSTVLGKPDSAIIEVPFVYKNCCSVNSASSLISLISASGDTIAKWNNREPRNTISFTVPTQTQITVSLEEKQLSEYGKQEFTIDVPIATRYQADTVYFIDSIPPEYEPTKRAFDAREGIKFNVFDNGSGVNGEKIVAFTGNDTLDTYYQNGVLELDNFCKSKCMLQIYLEDYAKNTAADFYWNVKSNNDSLYVEGPYLMDGYWK
ncbi:hypothetical protein [Fibrobacter sp.]|uniref:hypothetical protein n=1 Tax=Fibrobacter sp. TaxID=35828 RepID=UPI003890573A